MQPSAPLNQALTEIARGARRQPVGSCSRLADTNPYGRRLLDNIPITRKPPARASEAAAVSETFPFAVAQANRLLGRLAFVIGRAARSPGPDAIHDLRVAIRRFQQALAVFAPCFPAKDTKKTGRRLKRLMALAGEVRNCDIAARLLSRSGKAPALHQKIEAQRKEACARLTALLQRQSDRNWFAKWRARLGEADAAAHPHFSQSAIQSTASSDSGAHGDGVFHSWQPRRGSQGLRPQAASVSPRGQEVSLHAGAVGTPVYGADLAARLEPIRAVQTLLGDVNDCRTARDLIASWEGGQEFDARLRKRQRRKTKEFAATWNETLAGPKRARQWIRYLSRAEAKTPVPRKGAARAGSTSAAARVA